MKILFNFTLNIVELLVLFAYSKTMFDYKYSFKKSVLTTSAIYCVLFIIKAVFPEAEWLNVLSLCIGNILFFYTSFKVDVRSSFFHGILVSTVLYLTEVVTIFSISTILHLDTNHYKENFSLYILDAILSKMFYGISIFVFLFFKLKRYRNKEFGTYWYMVIMPIGSTICILSIRYLVEQVAVSKQILIFCLASCIFLLLGNTITFLIYESAQKNNQKIMEMKITEQRNIINENYLKVLEEKNNALQILAHDIKHHLSTISSIACSDEVDKYISLIIGDVQKYVDIGKTGNRILDLIISKYYSICNEYQISFKIHNFSDNLSFMNDKDISSLMNNLLDNAVEAASKCETNREISLAMHKKKSGMHILTLTNSCVSKPIHNNRQLVTTKSDLKLHGIGTKSVKKVIQKYNGDAEWFYDEEKHQFQIVVIFPEQ